MVAASMSAEFNDNATVVKAHQVTDVDYITIIFHFTPNGFIAHICRLYSSNFLGSFYCLCVCMYASICVLFFSFYGLMPEVHSFIHLFIQCTQITKHAKIYVLTMSFSHC